MIVSISVTGQSHTTQPEMNLLNSENENSILVSNHSSIQIVEWDCNEGEWILCL